MNYLIARGRIPGVSVEEQLDSHEALLALGESLVIHRSVDDFYELPRLWLTFGIETINHSQLIEGVIWQI